MTSALDMSLDDIIKNNKKPASRGRGLARGSGPGPSRRFANRAATRAAPYSAPKASETPWQHDLFTEQGIGLGAQAGRASAIENGTKLYISNLDYGVTNDDIQELFSEFGGLKSFAIHYDQSGRSKGTAEIVFSRRTDALAAVKRYNNVQLDGKPMKIDIVGTNIITSAAPLVANGTLGNLNGVSRGGQGRGGPTRRPPGDGVGRGFGRGRQRGAGRGRGEKVSAEDLDADLQKYHSEAMQTN